MAGCVCKGVGIVHGGGLQEVTRVSQAACLLHNHELSIWLVGLLHEVVNEDRSDLQIVEGAQVGAAGNGLLRIQTPVLYVSVFLNRYAYVGAKDSCCSSTHAGTLQAFTTCYHQRLLPVLKSILGIAVALEVSSGHYSCM